MALQSTTHVPQLAQSNGNAKGTTRSVKKQRSLSALLTSKSRRPSKSQSRPPSPPTPVTPKIPDQYLPAPLQTFTSEHDLSTRRKSSDGPSVVDRRVERPQSKHSVEQLSVEEQRERVRRSSGLKDAEHGAPNLYELTTENGPTQPDAASMSQFNPAKKSKAHHSPTFPISQKRSCKALRQPISRQESRLRGFSTTLGKTQGEAPTNNIHPRPATAAGASSSHERNIWFPESTDERPLSQNKGSAPRMPWRDLQKSAEVRTSFRSALTNSSSLVNAASTDRSSVATRCTSVSESTIEILGKAPSNDNCMTADDAIDMYAAGFADDTDSERASLKEKRRSMRIAEAINDQIGSVLLPPKQPSTSESRSSAAIMSGAAFIHDPPRIPPILPPTSTRDQYGFLKASHYVTPHQHDAWHMDYLPQQERRTRKWLSYMRESKFPTYPPSEFPSRSAKTQRFIRKGIPPAWRGSAWFFYAWGETHLQKNPNLYSTLVQRSSTGLNDNDKEIIERDLHRTFPDNIHFKPDPFPTTEPLLLISLRNVLRAFSLHSPRIGYCQSLNFIAGLLLLFLPEEKAFWMLHIITTTYLPGTHEISLEGANVDLWVLMTALKDSLPSIWTKISSGGGGDDQSNNLGIKLPPISLCTTSWFMSLFIGTLPIESVLRVWDVLFYEGSRTLFRVAVAIFKIGEQRIKSVNESMEMFQVVQGLPREMLDVGTLLSVAMKRGGVSQEWVERRRTERRKWYAKERARVTGFEAVEDDRGIIDAKPRRAESLWRRKKL